MPAEEWIEGGHLVPPCNELRIGVAKEAAHVSTYIHQGLYLSWSQEEARRSSATEHSMPLHAHTAACL